MIQLVLNPTKLNPVYINQSDMIVCRFYKSVFFVGFDRCFLLHKVYMKSNPTKTPTRVESHETKSGII